MSTWKHKIDRAGNTTSRITAHFESEGSSGAFGAAGQGRGAGLAVGVYDENGDLKGPDGQADYTEAAAVPGQHVRPARMTIRVKQDGREVLYGAFYPVETAAGELDLNVALMAGLPLAATPEQVQQIGAAVTDARAAAAQAQAAVIQVQAGLDQMDQITRDYQGVRIGEDALYLDGAQAAEVVLDSAGQVLEYTDQSGVKHLPGGLSVAETLDTTLQTDAQWIDGQVPALQTRDAAGQIIEYTDQRGTKHLPHGLEIGALRLSVVDTDLWIDGERPAEIVQDSTGQVVRYTTLDGRTINQGSAAPAAGSPANLTINATGDSMTEGAGSSTFRRAAGSGYPGMLAALLGRPVNNLGSAGQTAAEIAARTARSHNPNAAQFLPGAVSGGVYPLTLQNPGNGPLASDIYREQRGRLDGVPGLLFRAGNTTDTSLNTNRDGAYQFRPDAAVTLRATALTWVPSVPPAQYTLAWLGRNNADDTAQTGVAADAIRASLPLGARYIEIGILAAGTESTTTSDAGQRANLTRIRTYNARRAGLVGWAFVDPNTVICVNADGTPRADGSPNPDYMADNLHCNDAGYQRIAQALATLIRALEADLYWSVLP